MKSNASTKCFTREIMKLAKQLPEPSPLVNFFEQSLAELGAVTDRAWHDRLDVIADDPAARLWGDDGQFHSTALFFPEPGSTGARDAATEVFPGCPLTFGLAETLWREKPLF